MKRTKVQCPAPTRQLPTVCNSSSGDKTPSHRYACRQNTNVHKTKNKMKKITLFIFFKWKTCFLFFLLPILGYESPCHVSWVVSLCSFVFLFFFFHQTFNQREMTNYQFHFFLQVAAKACYKEVRMNNKKWWLKAGPTTFSHVLTHNVFNGLPHNGNHFWGTWCVPSRNLSPKWINTTKSK